MRLAGLVLASMVLAAACSSDQSAEKQNGNLAIAVGNAKHSADAAVDTSAHTRQSVGSVGTTAGSLGDRAGDAQPAKRLEDALLSGRVESERAAQRLRAPAESHFLREGALTADAFETVNDGRAWTDAVREFENDGLTDPEARDLHQLFGDWLRTSLSRHGLEISGFGCGQTLCAATIPLVAADARERYDAWREIDSIQPPMPLPVFAESAFTWPSGSSEMRVLFSTDPDIAMIRMP